MTPKFLAFLRPLGVLSVLASCAGLASAQDFVAKPRAMCDYMSKAGLRAQFNWGKPQPDAEVYFCQHAEQFASHSHYVGGGRAMVDLAKKEVGLGISVQVMGGERIRLEVRDKLAEYVKDLYKAQGQAVPPRVAQILASETEGPQQVGKLKVEYSTAYWEQHGVLGFTVTSPASPALLAQVGKGPSASEKAATQDLQARLDQRCQKAVAGSGQASTPAQWKRQAHAMGAYGYLFTYDQADGQFTCQVCDELAPGSSCSSMGTMLSFKPTEGSAQTLLSELDLKCVDSLQRRIKDADEKQFIDAELVKRIVVTPMHTDTRWAYRLMLDDEEFRCVIRRSDASYLLERKRGNDWQGVSAGRMM